MTLEEMREYERQRQQAASEAAANEDFKYRKTSELVSEELANNLFSGSSVDLTKKATVKDFFNVVFLDVRKNSADLSNLNTRVEEIATSTTTNELVLENNNLVKTAMTRAIQMLVGTSFASSSKLLRLCRAVISCRS